MYSTGSGRVRNAHRRVVVPGYYATVCVTSPVRALPQVALKTVTMQCAVKAGMAQGELQGALSNLQTVCRIVAPLVWPNIFAWGSKVGRPQLLYFSAAAANLLQLQLSTVIGRSESMSRRKGGAAALPSNATEGGDSMSGSGSRNGHASGSASGQVTKLELRGKANEQQQQQQQEEVVVVKDDAEDEEQLKDSYG